MRKIGRVYCPTSFSLVTDRERHTQTSKNGKKEKRESQLNALCIWYQENLGETAFNPLDQSFAVVSFKEVLEGLRTGQGIAFTSWG